MADLSNSFFDPNGIELVSGEPPSTLFTILSKTVKYKFPKMPSLRRSPSTHNLRASPIALGKRPQNLGLGTLEVHAESTELASLVPASVAARPTFESRTADKGWKYANQGEPPIFNQVKFCLLMSTGLNLLETAVYEAQCPDSGNQAFARQLYIHSLAYLLRGLPSDISEVEVASLRPAILPLLEIYQTGSRRNSSSGLNSQENPPSLLHRLIASSIIQLFVVFSFILPYVTFYLRSAYKYERTHHISERTFAASMDAVDHVGRKGFGLAGTILKSGNGRTGELLAGIFNGISGGIQDGVGEGMAMISSQRTSGRSI